MKIIAVVPARGGSKGIKNKNLKLVGGLPLVARSILTCKGVDEISHTYVSSDSTEILNVGEQFGATAILRPANYSSDTSSTEDFIDNFIETLEKKGEVIDILVYLQCTSPFTSTEDVKKVINGLLINPKIDCTFSAIEDHSFLWQVDNSGVGLGVNHQAYKQRLRRQDLKLQQFKETGAIYAIRVEAYKKTQNRFCSAALPIPLSGTLPFEIDNEFELDMARQLAGMFPIYDSMRLSKSCKALVMDFDGVLTDDKATINQFGHESVTCSRSDGLGIQILRAQGIKMLIVTREDNSVVKWRASKIGIEIVNGVRNKIEILKRWALNNKLAPNEIAYVGNDVNDIDCLSWVGFPFAPSDAHSKVLQSGCYILSSSGGSGVIREIAELFSVIN